MCYKCKTASISSRSVSSMDVISVAGLEIRTCSELGFLNGGNADVMLAHETSYLRDLSGKSVAIKLHDFKVRRGVSSHTGG